MYTPKILRYGPFGKLYFPIRFTKNYLLHMVAKILPSSAFVHRLRGVKIGRRVQIGSYVHIDDIQPFLVHIEDDVTISPHAMFFTTSYHHSLKVKEVEAQGDIYLKKGCFVGADSIILPGVTIGEGAIVGAGSVVLKDVDPLYIVAGSPAKVVGKRK